MAVKNGNNTSVDFPTRGDGRKYSKTDTTAPSAPTLTSTVSGTNPQSEIDIEITSPGVDSQSSVVSHNIYRSLAVGGPFTLRQSVSMPATTWTDGNLLELTTYHYRATAVNAFGLESSAGAVDDATTTSPQGSVIPWPIQDAVSYTPIARNLRGPGVNTPAGSGRTINTVHTPGTTVTASTIRKVTSTAFSGAGTLNAAITAHNNGTGPSTIVFECSGTIDGNGSDLPLISRSLLSIYGETSPDGIQIKRSLLNIKASDVYVSHLAVRYVFDGAKDSVQLTGNSVPTVARIVANHLSATWGGDETLSFVGNEVDCTVANSIIAEGCGAQFKSGVLTAHQFSSLHPSGCDTLLFYGNLIMSSKARNPLTRSLQYAQVNCVTYNCDARYIEWSPGTGAAQVLTSVGSVWIDGPSWGGVEPVSSPVANTLNTSSAVYWSDNRWEQSGGVVKTTYNDCVSTAIRNRVAAPQGSPSFWPTGLVAASAVNAKSIVLSHVGSRPGQRDTVSARMVQEVGAKTGSLKLLNTYSLGIAGVGRNTTSLAHTETPTYGTGSWSFPASPPSGGDWNDIVATDYGNYTKLEAYIHSLEDGVL